MLALHTTSTRPTFRRLLVGYDGSPSSEAALRWARQLARRLPAALTVLSVHDPGGRPPPLPRPTTPGVLGPEVHVYATGLPSRVVLAEAQSRDIDLVVLGKRGTVTERGVGANARRVARRSPVATLLVPPDSALPQAPRITIAGALGGDGLLSASCSVGALARRLGGELELLHVHLLNMGAFLPSESVGVHWAPLPDFGSDAGALLARCAHRASRACGLRIGTRVRSALTVPEGIVAALAAEGADLLVITPRARKTLGVAWLGGIAATLLRRIEQPLLLLRPTPALPASTLTGPQPRVERAHF